MSSKPEQTAAVQPKDDSKQHRRSLTRSFLTRAKTVLKRGESSSKGSKDGDRAPAVAAPPKPQPPPLTKSQEARAKYEAMPGVSKLSKSDLFEERAKKLGERFGLEIKPSEWQSTTPDDSVLRMDKPIRMRVRRSCHKCNANFTSAKECPNCQHVRCTKCARYPPKRTEAEIIASREKKAAIIKANKENAPIVPDYGFDEKEIVLTRPSKTGGQDLVYKKPRQRVRRTCHECKALFATGSKTCEKCSHTRCTDCPRDPPKKDKYPFGYPGDAFGPSSIPRFECQMCKTLFPTGAENGTKCRICQTEKSDDSPRAAPRKVEPEPDPEIMKKIEEKLRALKVEQ